ncbi:5-formyltetrahydrofolate cyclo-ligase [Burkholderia plantarii]|uniref:5-formyltetrahydrofolate cyclo-ligase n=1 Tax=Burkholderia plantarii TaxID=41899 RepID=UPI0018DB842E|nr:5-formyltetrahydrofolate cyclo-ligase [Burkholderia plantarii]MBI0327060.1 5-formyltetrahydrofolate cyclo-ligase [Burkholderia plantarii]
MSESIARPPVANRKRVLRETLAPLRRAVSGEAAANAALARRVLDLLGKHPLLTVGFYWPLPGEFDARPTIAEWLGDDARRRAALPVIAQPYTPLSFRTWTPDAPMRTGHHRIPEPAGGEPVVPDLLLIPCVGFDRQGFRLGYGGGYYDRTLAAWPNDALPVTIGVAYEALALDALPRESHDRPLDWIVTECYAYRSGSTA